MKKNFGTIRAALTFKDAFRDAVGIDLPWGHEDGPTLEIPDGRASDFLAGWEARVAAAAKATTCMDCGGEDFGYMVKNDVWKEVGLRGKDRVCLRCLEKRLGRPVSPGDLTDALINEPIRHGIGMGG